ncbi:hypothetical protein LS66_004740 [Helicobacter sp. MIT 03-1614]|uniref:hypothetical protein n=1 Tax=unclassified Helicobacter TaxID=2593540 RepID=UPI0005142525|nr:MULTISPECIES: hypothetical protein [unclassified Helicobacter]TLD89616.1 hypothetical protein LS66_004740 [Helicobacter sp. MIT 03-1614]
MNTPYITKNGEITTKAQLISEIEQLLNVIPASHTTLSPAVMDTLSCVDLENVRDNLLQKSNDVIAQNKQWLLGLVNE